MPKEKWPEPEEDNLLIDDEKYSEDWPSNEPPNTGDIATAHFNNENGEKTLIIKRQPKDKELFNKEKLIEFYDEQLNLPKNFNEPAKQGLSEKYLKGHQLPKSQIIKWNTPHKESIKDEKAKRHEEKRRGRKAIGKRI